MESLLTTGVILFIIYKLYMRSTRKDRETMHQAIQKDKEQKPKSQYYFFYKKGKIDNRVEIPKGSLDYSYRAEGVLSIKDFDKGVIELVDNSTSKFVCTFVDKKLCNNIKYDDCTYTQLKTNPKCKPKCRCYTCYNNLREEFWVSIKTLVQTNVEEVAKIKELNGSLFTKGKSKFNEYLKSVNLYMIADNGRKKIPS